MKHKIANCGMIGLKVSINCGSNAEKYKSALGLDISKIKPLRNTVYLLPALFFDELIFKGPESLKIALNPRYSRYPTPTHLIIENRVCDAIMRAAIPVADKRKKTTFAIAIPEITKTDLLNPLDADSAVTAIAAGPGESTTTKVVTRKRISVSIGIMKFSEIVLNITPEFS